MLRQHWALYAGLTFTTGVMQLATTVISVLLGRHYFEEGNLKKRLLGSVIMALGAALIVVFGARLSP